MCRPDHDCSIVDISDTAQSTPPTEVYVFPSVNVINVPAVLDKEGHLRCATTSIHRAECPDPGQTRSNATIATVNNSTQSRGHSTAFHITGINSNAEAYFSNRQKLDSAIMSSKFDMVQVSFSKPFVYAPLSDQYPSNIVNENFGYVPQTLIEWIAQQSDYVSKFPSIASCLPGGPSIDFNARETCPHSDILNAHVFPYFLIYQTGADDLTVSTTVTIAGRGCFHPGACPTPAAPGAAAAATTPLVTPEALPQSGMPVSCCLQQIHNILLTIRSSTYPKSATSTSSEAASGSPSNNARQHSSTVSPESSG